MKFGRCHWKLVSSQICLSSSFSGCWNSYWWYSNIVEVPEPGFRCPNQHITPFLSLSIVLIFLIWWTLINNFYNIQSFFYFITLILKGWDGKETGSAWKLPRIECRAHLSLLLTMFDTFLVHFQQRYLNPY